ncbi:MAG: TonB-dependent receptor [Sphingobacteriia bacterium]|nr:MAG: TonB-dependent receptor [Sphingobacteriia bacterium]
MKSTTVLLLLLPLAMAAQKQTTPIPKGAQQPPFPAPKSAQNKTTDPNSDTVPTTAYFLQPLEVKAIRASDRAPFAKTNLDKSTIEKNNLGQDIPFLLQQTPSVVVHSDAGNGVGYTGIRIRGTDATRINVTLNGIPYNDAESMGTFFVNLPDFASSVNSIQIQRGVGTSSNGASAFGATLNMSTNSFQGKPYLALNNSVGSFQTFKNTLLFGTGLMGKHFTLDGRLSNVQSNGYIDRASSRLRAFYVSLAFTREKSSLRLNVFSGKEKTYQAWYGIDANTLANNRRFNPAGTEKPGSPYENQTDNYTQTHYQLFYNLAVSSKWSFQNAFFLTRGKGFYEEYRANQRFTNYGLVPPIIGGIPQSRTDLIRQLWLDNYFYGQILSLQYKSNKQEFVIGGGWSQYTGDHFGRLPWVEKGPQPSPDFAFYFTPARKSDHHIYAKWQYRLTDQLSSFVDLQYRGLRHQMNGFRNNPQLIIDRNFSFFNPKAGLSYAQKGWLGFLSLAVGQKEPNRDDFESGASTQPLSEKLYDWEAGLEKKTTRYQYGFTLYHMGYRNQLVQTGKINDVGAYTRVNVDRSVRMGVELQGSVAFTSQWQLGGNLTWSRNKIKSFTEFIDDYDNGGQILVQHQNTDIAFSPRLTAQLNLNYAPNTRWNFGWSQRHVGRQFLDNTQNPNRALSAFWVSDLKAIYNTQWRKDKPIQVIGQVNNVFNHFYAPNGYTFSYLAGGQMTTENYFYPMAGIHYMLAVNIGF